ncbi:phosphatidylglycerol lysyltransferase domain-containing protein [Acinetobacter sp. UGAL515B_02]|nr:phosphatidylglycerol lysyltransferase domain-containing protein [Acinetobacter sp. UGAL515B_02]WON80649.1 phosphatidylglycerol lysyltransferase domain-containing protein [Acinetobacter sp. UGAL515B_02]
MGQNAAICLVQLRCSSIVWFRAASSCATLAQNWHHDFDLGEEFYNFEGLYEYKAKFNPVWQSRYLATPAGLSAPFTLLTITRLIAGGWKGIIKK